MKHPTSRLVWSGQHTTGIAVCDGEHQVMFMLYNDFSRAMESRVSAAYAARVFDTLASHVRTHFTREDRLLAHHGMVLPPHRLIARRDFRRIAETIDLCLRSGGNRQAALVQLRDWIDEHVAADAALFAGFPAPSAVRPTARTASSATLAVSPAGT
ncbi:bacteriohemerythrin [Azospirillum sp. ST 5-10]|uniref:bacteriohemerythrin n=1 Tax=unclassified Azospirillum TaxID=2630922 RepID=UPI003F49D168